MLEIHLLSFLYVYVQIICCNKYYEQTASFRFEILLPRYKIKKKNNFFSFAVNS